jgi:hypothetical protein
MKILATPGLGDNRGEFQDTTNLQNVITTFQAEGDMHGIVFCIPTNRREPQSFRGACMSAVRLEFRSLDYWC